MIIAKSAVEAWLRRKGLKDFRVCAQFSHAKLEQYMQALPVMPPIWHKLFRHQKICLIIGAKLKRFAFISSTGTGKSLVCLALAQYFKAAGIAKRFLILVPARTNKYEWEREIQKHAPGIPYVLLTGSSQQKWALIAENPDALVVVATYPGLVRMVCSMAPGRKGKNKLKPNAKLVRDLCATFDGAFLDESHTCKNPRALPYRICRQLSKSCEVFFTLTGTPFGRDPQDLWAQMYLVDHGRTLGQTITLFRKAFFTAKTNYWGGEEYKFDRKKEALLHRFLANRSIRFMPNTLDLPDCVEIKKYVKLPEDADSYYQRAKKMIIDANGNYREMKNAFLRMRQISSGFIGFADDDTGARAEFTFPENPKLECLLALLEGIRDKVVIYHDFIHSGSMIAKELAKRGWRYAEISGKVKDPQAALHAFTTNPRCRFLLLSNAMAIGLNLQIARYGVFFESPVPVITRTQAKARFVRQGSEHARVFLYDLVVQGTVDEQILSFHAQGRDLFRAIVEGAAKPH